MGLKGVDTSRKGMKPETMRKYNKAGPDTGNPAKAGGHRKSGGQRKFKDSHRS